MASLDARASNPPALRGSFACTIAHRHAVRREPQGRINEQRYGLNDEQPARLWPAVRQDKRCFFAAALILAAGSLSAASFASRSDLRRAVSTSRLDVKRLTRTGSVE